MRKIMSAGGEGHDDAENADAGSGAGLLGFKQASAPPNLDDAGASEALLPGFTSDGIITVTDTDIRGGAEAGEEDDEEPGAGEKLEFSRHIAALLDEWGGPTAAGEDGSAAPRSRTISGLSGLLASGALGAATHAPAE